MSYQRNDNESFFFFRGRSLRIRTLRSDEHLFLACWRVVILWTDWNKISCLPKSISAVFLQTLAQKKRGGCCKKLFLLSQGIVLPLRASRRRPAQVGQTRSAGASEDKVLFNSIYGRLRPSFFSYTYTLSPNNFSGWTRIWIFFEGS